MDACANVEKLDAAIGQYYGQAVEIVPDESSHILNLKIDLCVSNIY